MVRTVVIVVAHVMCGEHFGDKEYDYPFMAYSSTPNLVSQRKAVILILIPAKMLEGRVARTSWKSTFAAVSFVAGLRPYCGGG